MCNRTSELVEFREKIHKDIQSEIWKYYDDKKIKYKKIEEENPETTIIDFLSYNFRLISQISRKVHYSKELRDKINSNKIETKYVEVLKEYDEAFSEGRNMNIFCSNKNKEVRKVDFLLYTWNLYHLHMSGKFVETEKQMKNNRSDMQLICIIDQRDVFFIDVISHPMKSEEYFCEDFLNIIANNKWMNKIGFYKCPEVVPNTLTPLVSKCKELFDLYSKGALNLMINIQGQIYCPMSPMSIERRPNKSVNEMRVINNKIKDFYDLNVKYNGFKLEHNDNGEILGIINYKNESLEGKFTIFNL